ncbi:MAG: cupin domain-containing protein [Candidatus Thermoplasmatota archaeon]|nr:cupin domain-containing protein [Candidatus Thermoplasmatota archaeon]
MIYKLEQALKRKAAGIEFRVLARGEKAMVTRFDFSAGEEVPVHSHPHEQAGYVASGRARMSIDGEETVITEGDSYYIPGGVEHGLVALENCVVLDFFTPPREEYL